MEKCSIYIVSKWDNKFWSQEPVVTEGITWETARSGEPAKLTFTVIKDNTVDSDGIPVDEGEGATNTEYNGIKFNEGDRVSFYYGETPVFFGYVFEKKRNKDHHIEVTCYDPTFYLKAKEHYVMTNVRLDQIVSRVADDIGLPFGYLENTEYYIPKFAKSESTLFDIIGDAITETYMATGDLYCLYWDFENLVLKHSGDMVIPIQINSSTAEDFDYSTSINGNTYNSVVVKVEDSKSQVFNNFDSQDKWGVLQIVVDKQAGKTPKETADIVLSMYNRVSRTLNVNGALGDVRVRGGSSVYVDLNLGDHRCNQILLVSRATHTFDNGHHSMELTLIDGRGFYGK